MKAEAKIINTDEKKSQITALVTGVLIGFAITCIVFIGYAILLTYTEITENNIDLVVTITSVVAVMLAGYDAAKGAKDNGWLWGIIAGVLYAIILIAIETWVLKGFSTDSRTISITILSIAGGGLGGVIGINMNNKNKSK